MLLVVQIAAGIVLGFAIIAYRAVLLRYARWIAAFVGMVALIGLSIGIGSEAVRVAEPYLGKIFSKIGLIFAELVLLGFAVLGGLNFRELVYQIGWRKRRPSTMLGPPESAIILATLANVILVYAISWPILHFTLAGDWYESLDKWSREIGFEDGGGLLIAAIFWQWPVLPIWILSRRKGHEAEVNQSENSLNEGEG